MEKNLGGRPPLWDEPEDLQKKIDEFYAYIKETGKPMTIGRFCIFVWMTRQTYRDYKDNKVRFSCTIKKLVEEILADKEERLIDKETFTPWLIFDLKNNHRQDFQDKQEVEQTVKTIDISEDNPYEDKS